MKWLPKYTNSNKLLLTIRQIGEAVGEIKQANLTKNSLATLELQARELSTFASTSIEGNPLPLTDVKQLIKKTPPQIRDTEREVVNYNRTLKVINSAVKEDKFNLNRKAIEGIQKFVVENLMDNPTEIGAFRQNPVIIRDPRVPDSIVFIPPDAKDVPEMVASLCTFIKDNVGYIDPVILAGLFHRQFVIIHPFMDGNGRTTRLLTTAILGMAGLDVFEIFSFENYYNQNITRYFKAVGLEGDYYDLQNDIDFTEWLEYFAEGILDELTRVRKGLATLTPKPRLEPHHKLILDYIQEHGSINQQEYGSISPRSLASRKVDFRKLVDMDLIEPTGGGRSVYYVAVNK